jgi:hypothetical protein
MLFNEDDSQEDLGPNLAGFLRKVETGYLIENDADGKLPLNSIAALVGGENVKAL